jgi:putative protein-disulfide isomerase
MKTKTFSIFILSFILLISIDQHHTNAQENPKPMKAKIIYIYDAYCGWCYGFSPVINAFHQKYQNDYTFEVISGGLIIGDRVGPMDPNMAKYIKGAIPRLMDVTGVKISEAYVNTLGNPTRINDSMIPAKAMAAFRKFEPNRVVEFTSWLQKAQFVDAKDLTQIEVYQEAAQTFNLPAEDFIREMEASESIAKSDFMKAQQWGITGFPAVVFDRGDTLIALSNGFTDLPNLETSLKQALEYEHK